MHRLPDPILAITAATVTAGLTIACARSADPRRRPAAAAVCGGFYLLWALLVADSVGLGDIRWAAVLALVTGWLGVPVPAVLAAGAVIAAVTMGPCLRCGGSTATRQSRSGQSRPPAP